ncbi:phosphotransferase [Cryptosporangium phraense]|uniref:Phosphotransferase n=1 Tax=Cryptosporangium phraense TaxID=2593070 RepID=A0A545AKG5_9ACTN|nr:phosphotransferase [Cryptosporangium phraense]TQS41813.1 phosphotransferase [Cryptosporangium phraense]
MTSPVFVKRHPDAACVLAARRHRDWLEQLGSGIRLPHAHPGTGTLQILERIEGRQPEIRDLVDLAIVLGRLHGTAYQQHLHAAQLDDPFTATPALTIPDFCACRQQVLARFDVPVGGDVAFYKDANLRNFLITTDGPAVVDFDDLTLAPFGYDLAKLVVSLVMTYGSIAASAIHEALDAYNTAVVHAGGPASSATAYDLALYAEIHHVLTARYLHRNGYEHSWADTRPWPIPI